MLISRIDLGPVNDRLELSGWIDDFRLWYRFPLGLDISARGDAFLAAALMPAMVKGEPLEVDGQFPVSPRLLAGIAQLQDILPMWYPQRFHKIQVRAAASPCPAGTPAVASFFSGGVDGSYTFLKHADEITHLAIAQGIDMQLDNDALFQEVLASIGRFTQTFGKALVPIQTNLRRLGRAHGIGWELYSGGGLASIALALGCHKTYIASTHTYAELFPFGSHALTDPLWSSEGVQLVHDGAEATRSEKLAKVCTCAPALDILRVCWQDAGYNCGICEKCVRTRITLRLLGKETPTLPPLEALDAVYRIQIDNHEFLTYYADLLELAETKQDAALTRALRHCIRRYERKRLAVSLDQVFFRGRLKHWYKQLVKK